jgi:hypothetical protein
MISGHAKTTVLKKPLFSIGSTNHSGPCVRPLDRAEGGVLTQSQDTPSWHIEGNS